MVRLTRLSLTLLVLLCANAAISADGVRDYFEQRSPEFAARYQDFVEQDPCFLPLWTVAYKRSLGEEVPFNLNECLNEAKNIRLKEQQRLEAEEKRRLLIAFFVEETGRTEEDFHSFARYDEDFLPTWKQRLASSTDRTKKVKTELNRPKTNEGYDTDQYSLEDLLIDVVAFKVALEVKQALLVDRPKPITINANQKIIIQKNSLPTVSYCKTYGYDEHGKRC